MFRFPTCLVISVGDFPGKGIAESGNISISRGFGASFSRVPPGVEGPWWRKVSSSTSLMTLSLFILKGTDFEMEEKSQ